MMGLSLREKREGRLSQVKVRNLSVVDARTRSTGGPMGKHGKGRSRYDARTRSSVRADLRQGEWA